MMQPASYSMLTTHNYISEVDGSQLDPCNAIVMKHRDILM